MSTTRRRQRRSRAHMRASGQLSDSGLDNTESDAPQQRENDTALPPLSLAVAAANPGTHTDRAQRSHPQQTAESDRGRERGKPESEGEDGGSRPPPLSTQLSTQPSKRRSSAISGNEKERGAHSVAICNSSGSSSGSEDEETADAYPKVIPAPPQRRAQNGTQRISQDGNASMHAFGTLHEEEGPAVAPASSSPIAEALMATVHRTDVLRPMPHLLRPFVRVRCIDAATGRCLKTLRRSQSRKGQAAAAARRAAARLSEVSDVSSRPATPAQHSSGNTLSIGASGGSGHFGSGLLRPSTPSGGRPPSRLSLRRLNSWGGWRRGGGARGSDVEGSGPATPGEPEYEDDALDTPLCVLPVATNVLPQWEVRRGGGRFGPAIFSSFFRFQPPPSLHPPPSPSTPLPFRSMFNARGARRATS